MALRWYDASKKVESIYVFFGVIADVMLLHFAVLQLGVTVTAKDF